MSRRLPLLLSAFLWAPGIASPQDVKEKKLPPFTLTAAGGESFTLAVEEGRVSIARKDGPAKEMKAVLLHFFQPDCNACHAEMKAIEKLRGEVVTKGAFVASVAHRGDDAAVRDAAERLGITYPLLLGQGSELARDFARGDATVIADGEGAVRFSQVGFKDGDEKVFKETVERLLADRDVTAESSERRSLEVGDAFPPVRLPGLMSGKPLSLAVEDGKLTFRDPSGRVTRPRAAIGFFSRY